MSTNVTFFVSLSFEIKGAKMEPYLWNNVKENTLTFSDGVGILQDDDFRIHWAQIVFTEHDMDQPQQSFILAKS